MKSNTSFYMAETTFTTIPKVAETYHYLKQLSAETQIADSDSIENLKEKFQAIKGLTARVNAGLDDFVRENFNVSLDDELEKTPLNDLGNAVKSLVSVVFFEKQVTLSKDYFEKIDTAASCLPFIISKLEENLKKN